MSEYKLKGARLSDIATAQVSLTAAGGDLGAVDGADILVSRSEFPSESVAADFIKAYNRTTALDIVVTIDGDDFRLAAVADSDIVDLVIKL